MAGWGEARPLATRSTRISEGFDIRGRSVVWGPGLGQPLPEAGGRYSWTKHPKNSSSFHAVRFSRCLWKGGKLEMLLYGDRVGAVNCLEPHPYVPTLATRCARDPLLVFVGLGKDVRRAGVASEGPPCTQGRFLRRRLHATFTAHEKLVRGFVGGGASRRPVSAKGGLCVSRKVALFGVSVRCGQQAPGGLCRG